MPIDTTPLWDAIGSAWQNFNSKDVVDSFWDGMASGIGAATQYLYEVQKSRTLPYMSATVDVGPNEYYFVYSGLSADLTVSLLASGGLFSYPLDEWTYSIPTITSIYKYQGTEYSYTYTEGVDYTISGMHYLVWGATPPDHDPRFIDKEALVGYAPHVYRLNPALMGIWAHNCGFTYDNFLSYAHYGQPSFLHLKMLIWALAYNRLKAPSIKVLQDSFGISRGMPFAFVSGLSSSTLNGSVWTVHVGGYDYVLGSGMVPIPDGTVVSQFDLLCSGLHLWDYVTNPILVNSYANSYNARNTLIYQIDGSLSTLAYDSTFHTAYVSGLMPRQVQYFID